MTQTIQHEYWMRQCLELANTAQQHGEVPVGAIVVAQQDGEDIIIGKGSNQPISSHDPSAHAEIVALRDAAMQQQNYRLPNTRLYVTIEPCVMCAGAIIHSRVSQLIFGAREPKAGAICSHLNLFNRQYGNHNIDYIEGILAQECSDIITHFFKKKRLQ